VHTAPIVAKVLLDNFFSKYGMPKRTLTDQGKELESELFKELCTAMEIETIRTSPYKPSTNGCIERFHRTLNWMLGKVVEINQSNRQPSVMAAYRAAKHVQRDSRRIVSFSVGKTECQLILFFAKFHKKRRTMQRTTISSGIYKKDAEVLIK